MHVPRSIEGCLGVFQKGGRVYDRGGLRGVASGSVAYCGWRLEGAGLYISWKSDVVLSGRMLVGRVVNAPYRRS